MLNHHMFNSFSNYLVHAHRHPQTSTDIHLTSKMTSHIVRRLLEKNRKVWSHSIPGVSLRSFRSSYHVPCRGRVRNWTLWKWDGCPLYTYLPLFVSCGPVGLLGQNLRPAIDTVFDGSSTPVLQDNVLGVSTFTRAHTHTRSHKFWT